MLGWKKVGLEQSLGARLVTYADDLVILCKRGKAEEALQQRREINPGIRGFWRRCGSSSADFA